MCTHAINPVPGEMRKVVKVFSMMATLTLGYVKASPEVRVRCSSNSDGHMPIMLARSLLSAQACLPVLSSWRRTICSIFNNVRHVLNVALGWLESPTHQAGIGVRRSWVKSLDQAPPCLQTVGLSTMEWVSVPDSVLMSRLAYTCGPNRSAP